MRLIDFPPGTPVKNGEGGRFDVAEMKPTAVQPARIDAPLVAKYLVQQKVHVARHEIVGLGQISDVGHESDALEAARRSPSCGGVAWMNSKTRDSSLHLLMAAADRLVRVRLVDGQEVEDIRVLGVEDIP